MKKALLIALVGFMFVAFASCGGGSKEYKTLKKMYNTALSMMDDAKDCEELHAIADDESLVMEKLGLTKEDLRFTEEERLSDEEEKELRQIEKELDKKYKEKREELCN